MSRDEISNLNWPPPPTRRHTGRYRLKDAPMGYVLTTSSPGACHCNVCGRARERGHLDVVISWTVEAAGGMRQETDAMRIRPDVSGESWEWRFGASHAGGFLNPCKAVADGAEAFRVIRRLRKTEETVR